MKRIFLENVGIYKLTCNINNKVYIGKSVDLVKRISRHRNTEKGTKQTYYLQHAIKKHGWESFSVEILEYFKDFDKTNDLHKQLILDRETDYIELYDSINKSIGYNICKHSTDNTGRQHSEETKEKMRKAHLGKVFSEEHRKNISLSREGMKMSDEARIKMSESRKGIPISEEARKNRIGKPRSEETKRKIGLASLGRKHTDESKEKIKLAATGRTHTKETMAKILEKRSWYKPTEETKEKMRIAHRERLAKSMTGDDDLSLLERLAKQ
jgi:group I intron endonuclease